MPLFSVRSITYRTSVLIGYPQSYQHARALLVTLYKSMPYLPIEDIWSFGIPQSNSRLFLLKIRRLAYVPTLGESPRDDGKLLGDVVD